MAKLDFPPASSSPWKAPTGIIYTYIGNEPNGYWSASASNASEDLAGFFVETKGDNMTGNLTLGPDRLNPNVQIDASNGTFLTSGYYWSNQDSAVLGGAYLFNATGASRTDAALMVANSTNANFPTITLNYDGSAQFAKNIVFPSFASYNPETGIYSAWNVQVDSQNYVMLGGSPNSNLLNSTVKIKADGSITANGTLRINNASGDVQAYLQNDGSLNAAWGQLSSGLSTYISGTDGKHYIGFNGTANSGTIKLDPADGNITAGQTSLTVNGRQQWESPLVLNNTNVDGYNIYSKSNGTGTFAVTTDGALFLGDDASPLITLKGSDGSAKFAGNVEANGYIWANGAASYIVVSRTGATGNTTVAEFGGDTVTSRIAADGSVEFAGVVTAKSVDVTQTASGYTFIGRKSDETATFYVDDEGNTKLSGSLDVGNPSTTSYKQGFLAVPVTNGGSYFQVYGKNGDVNKSFSVYNGDLGIITASIDSTGAAEFASRVTVVDSSTPTAYTRLYNGHMLISNTTAFGQAFGLYNTTTGKYEITMNMDGSARFAGGNTEINSYGQFITTRTDSDSFPALTINGVGTSTGNINLYGTGYASFASRCDFGSSSVADVSGKFSNNDASSATLYVTNHSFSGNLFSGRNANNAEVINLGVDGSAEFAGAITSTNGSGAVYYNLSESALTAYDSAANGSLPKVTINKSGSATFAGPISPGDADSGMALVTVAGETGACLVSTNKTDITSARTANIGSAGQPWNKAYFAGAVTASNITAFKSRMATAVANAADLSALKQAILDAVADL